MSEDWNEFDQVFQEKLGDFSIEPPVTVWENIQTERTFGHIVANRISRNWQIFGTFLFLVFIGGSAALSFGIEEHLEDDSFTSFGNYHSMENGSKTESIRIIHFNRTQPRFDKNDLPTMNSFPKGHSNRDFTMEKKRTNKNNSLLIYDQPDNDLLASVQAAGFSRPILQDRRLSAYIETLSGWESARPKSYTRHDKMSFLKKQAVHKETSSPGPIAVETNYDYVKEGIKNKPFKERLSILIALTPQSIRKNIVADFNLSSDYIEERNKREKTRFSYSFSASLQYEFSNHKFLETGLLFTQIYEEMYIEGEKRFSNQYDFIEIPVLFGYEQRNAKWGWHFKGGLGLQLLNSYKGYILNPQEDIRRVNTPTSVPQYRMKNTDAFKNIIANKHQLASSQNRDEVLDLSKEEENPFKRSGIFNIHMATGLTYYHSIKTNFLITPYYRRSINSITKEQTRFRENISYTGISLGARFKF